MSLDRVNEIVRDDLTADAVRERLVVDELDAKWEVRGSFAIDTSGKFPIVALTVRLFDGSGSEISQFRDRFQQATAEERNLVNEANAYKNDIVPRAKGEAEKRIAAAKAYKEQVIKEAEGEAARFLSVYETYKTAKDVTTRRLFLERMQDVLRRSNKIIIDKGVEGSGQGVVPYLPLNELQKRGQSGGNQ